MHRNSCRQCTGLIVAEQRTGVAELITGLLHPDARRRMRDAGAVAERLGALAIDANAASGEVALHIG